MAGRFSAQHAYQTAVVGVRQLRAAVNGKAQTALSKISTRLCSARP
jgi:hypothetical protein